MLDPTKHDNEHIPYPKADKSLPLNFKKFCS